MNPMSLLTTPSTLLHEVVINRPTASPSGERNERRLSLVMVAAAAIALAIVAVSPML